MGRPPPEGASVGYPPVSGGRQANQAGTWECPEGWSTRGSGWRPPRGRPYRRSWQLPIACPFRSTYGQTSAEPLWPSFTGPGAVVE